MSAPIRDDSGPDDICSLCHVKLSTGPCDHLIHLGEGRVGLKRSVWEALVADRQRLHDLEDSDIRRAGHMPAALAEEMGLDLAPPSLAERVADLERAIWGEAREQ